MTSTKIISTVLILISVIASLYYLFVGLVKSETVALYNRANIPRWGIQTWALMLGIGGILLLFPQTFSLAAVLMILNSLFTIGCFWVIRDYKGGFFELAFMQIPIFLLWVGYPLSVLENLKDCLR
jgi:hypothetical protein